MLFGERVTVYCENHTEHTNTLCGQNAEFHYVKAGGTYIDQWALKCLKRGFFFIAAKKYIEQNLIEMTLGNECLKNCDR
jgi:hypothetical protein